MTMNVRTIMAEWLREHGYDGLWNDDVDCGCKVDDLMPCEGFYSTDNCPNCQPGYLQQDEEAEMGWSIGPTKDAEEKKP